MGYSGNRVETTCRLAQWRIEDFPSCTYRESDPFKIGMWNWVLVVLDGHIKLYPDLSNISREKQPIVSLRFKVLKSLAYRWPPLIHSEIKDRRIEFNDDLVWPYVTQSPNFVIDIEFLDLKTASPRDEPCAIWDDQIILQKASNVATLQSLGVMLAEDIHKDFTVNASDGSVQAHRAILAARSPVFSSMFSSYNVEEKELSAIHIPDMSVKACQAFVDYLYGNIKHKDFMKYRLHLLHAADKYDVPDLKEVCHESLLKDINSKNVLERLQNASLYKLTELKMSCIQYLVNFGRLYDIHDDFKEFMEHADKDLITEIMAEMITSWT